MVLLGLVQVACLAGNAAAQSPIPLDISLDSTMSLLWAQHLQQNRKQPDDHELRRFERFKKTAANPRLDSLFRLTRAYLVEQLGEEVFLQKVGMEWFYAISHHSGSFDVRYHFFFDKVGEKEHYRPLTFYFLFDKATGGITRTEYPKLPDCKNNPCRCDFAVTDPTKALSIALEAGFLEKKQFLDGYFSEKSWAWEIKKRLNDDCLAQNVLVDMCTGKPSLGDTFILQGCTPLAKKVATSPIVIEGTVLENGRGYQTRMGIWTSRVVEVNRVFKGEIAAGVVEVIVFGGGLGDRFTSMSHGQLSLPDKGTTAIFFLRSPWEKTDPNDAQTIDSLSPYPVFNEHFYDPLELYDSRSDKLSFHLDIERNTYQAIEKAAGQRRSNVLLPAATDSLFTSWAVDHLRRYPVRELGLEYRLFKKHGKQPEDTIRLRLGIRSPSSHSYLTKSKIVLRYDPIAYGDSIVSKNRLAFTPLQRDPEYKHFNYGVMLPPKNYVFDLKDLTDSTFQIEITRTGEGDFFQVTPFTYHNTVLPALPIADLEIPVLYPQGKRGLDFVEEAMKNKSFHFDFGKNAEIPYHFVWANDPLDFLPERFRKK